MRTGPVRLLVSSAIRLSNDGAIGRFGSAAAVLMAEAGRVVISEDCLAAQDEMLAAMNDAVKCRELSRHRRETHVSAHRQITFCLRRLSNRTNLHS